MTLEYEDIKDEPRIPDPEEEIPYICVNCDEDPKTCGTCADDCEEAAATEAAESDWEGRREAHE